MVQSVTLPSAAKLTRYSGVTTSATETASTVVRGIDAGRAAAVSTVGVGRGALLTASGGSARSGGGGGAPTQKFQAIKIATERVIAIRERFSMLFWQYLFLTSALVGLGQRTSHGTNEL